MSLNQLTPITDYQSMLNRIFWFTSISALAAVWMLRLHIPEIDGLLNRIDFTFEFGGNKVFPVPGGYLVPALAVGIMTRVFHLHARISDWLGIRERFDVDVILRELAWQADIDLSLIAGEELVARRHDLMRRTFYPFVSGRQPQIDPQLVGQALDAWSWFWIGVEAVFVFTLTGLGLIAGGVWNIGFPMLGCTLSLAALSLPVLRGQCVRYALAQVRAIMDDPTRARAVRAAFTEGVGRRLDDRVAA